MPISITQYQPKQGLWTNAFAQAMDDMPNGGILLVPPGIYKSGPITLSSHVELRLEPGAVICFSLPPQEFPLCSCQYEGKTSLRPQACISAYGAENVSITGGGILDGNGMPWWIGHRTNSLPNGRPYLLHFEDCDGVVLRDIHLQNSPAWTIHPLRCQNVSIQQITICNPYDSPNTDGINPESCRNVRIHGCCVDVGDDCITLKAGTEETSAPPACENIVISDCCLIHGHGGIVIGSEMSGGVRNLAVSNCIFTGTDRGIRIKSRRHRGGVVENLTVTNLIMTDVICPFVCNMYYSCGTSEADRWCWEKTAYPVDGGTPVFRNIHISHITVDGASASAGFFYGLAESPILDLTIADCHIRMKAGVEPGTPAMMSGLEPVCGQGLFLRNTVNTCLSGVVVEGVRGPMCNTDETVTEFQWR